MPRFVVCVPVEGGPSVAPCTDADGVAYSPVVMELAAPGQPSFDNANQLFGYGFTWVIVLWCIGVCVGEIFSVIRKS